MFEILTENGFKPFDGIISRGTKKTILLELSNGKTLRCTPDHQLRMKDEYGEAVFIECMFLDVDDVLYNDVRIISKTEIDDAVDVYDALNVKDTHSYISDGVVSHNCNVLMLDEFAFLSNNLADEFIASVFPTLSSSKESKLVITSCVTKNTMVFTRDGIKTIESFVDQDKHGAYYVSEYEVLGKDKFNCGNILVNNGKTKTRIIRSSHAELECSLPHKLWAYKNGKFDWYKVEELKVGDWIAIQYGMNIWGSNDIIDFDYSPYENWRNKNLVKFNKITPDLAYLLGLYISEGYADRLKLTITCGDNISNVFHTLNLKYKCYDNIHYTISSLSLCDLIRYFGFDTSKKAKEKIIPERLFSMSKENIIGLLQGMFDGDGCATKRGFVVYYSTSKTLIEQVRMLLNNFGILSTVRKTQVKPTKKVKSESVVYTLEISAKHSKLFYDIIGFRLYRKQKRKEILENKSFSRDRYDVIPGSELLIKKYHLTTKCNIHTCKIPKNIQRKKMLEIKNVVADEYWKLFYDNAVSENIYWEQINTITDSENEVFDFSLYDNPTDKFCHSVVYNGIIGHQTPNGLNAFYKIWKEAQEGINDFVAVRGYWNELHNQEWADKQRKLLGEVRYTAEVECNFLGSSNTLVDGKFLATIPFSKPIYSKNSLNEFEQPNKSHSYVMTVDVARGRGLDHSAFIVYDITEMPFKVVATYKNNSITAVEFPLIIKKIAEFYNEALVVIENNDLGESVCNTLWYDLEYVNMIWTDHGEITSTGGNIGIRTTNTVKKKGSSKIATIIEQNQIVLSDFRIIQELQGYSLQKTGVYAAEDTNINDDLCTCLFLFGWLTNDPFFESLTGFNNNQKLTHQFESEVDDIQPIGFFSNGSDDDLKYQVSQDQRELLMM